MANHQQEVVITTKNTTSLTLGIIAVVLGVLALLVGWIPFLGLVAVPAAVLGGVLAIVGVLIAATKRFRGLGLPLLGAGICLVAFVIPLASTGSTSVAISESMDEVSREMKSQREAAQNERKRQEEESKAEEIAYVSSYLELYDVTAKRMESVLDGTVPGVLFKLKNTGEKTLSKVEVTVYFKDAEGNIIGEEDFLPVLVSEYSFGGGNKPLKPGYVWQMESGKFYSAKSVPSEWEEGNIDAAITDIEFSD
ncbi:MAG: hypothetical protein AB7N71_04590 [Phycisphaerae bacterium]